MRPARSPARVLSIATTPLSLFDGCARRYRLRTLVGLEEPLASGEVDLLDEDRARSGRAGSIGQGPTDRKGDLLGWHFLERVKVGGKAMRNLSGIGKWEEKEGSELHDALRAACSAPANQPIEIHLQFVTERAK